MGLEPHVNLQWSDGFARPFFAPFAFPLQAHWRFDTC